MTEYKYKDKDYHKKYYQKNKERIKRIKRQTYDKAYYQKHKEKIKLRSKQWRLNNPEKVKEYSQKHNKKYSYSEIVRRAHLKRIEKFKKVEPTLTIRFD